MIGIQKITRQDNEAEGFTPDFSLSAPSCPNCHCWSCDCWSDFFFYAQITGAQIGSVIAAC